MENKISLESDTNAETNTLQEALEEIRTTVKGTVHKGKPDISLLTVIERCGTYLGSLQQCFDYLYGPPSKDDQEIVKKELSKNWNFTEEDFNLKAPNPILSKRHVYMHTFQPQYAMYGLSAKPNTIALLPYLLSAFYLNCDITTGCPPDVAAVCVDHESEGNYSRNIRAFTGRFSLESYFDKFYKRKKSEAGKKIQGIKDAHSHLQYLFYPQMTGRKKKFKITELHYESIIRALVYSTCVVACLHTAIIRDCVDYEKSFELFNMHTLAFYTACLYSPPFNDEDDEEYIASKEEQLQYTAHICSYANEPHAFRHAVKALRKNYRNFSLKEQELFCNCGNHFSNFAKWEKYPNKNWYLNVASLVSFLFNPLNYEYYVLINW